MIKSFFIFVTSSAMIIGLVIFGWYRFSPPKEIAVSEAQIGSGTGENSTSKTVKSKEELIAEAFKKSKEIKGLYMTSDVAMDQGAGATRIRKNLIRIAAETEINGMVIDVKEVCGPDYNEENLKKLLDELHQKNIWAIARIVVFKDASQVDVQPGWYLTRSSRKSVGDECSRKKHLRVKSLDGKKSNVIPWQDKRGGYWLDPASEGARNYILEISKKIVDLGFDELQFDYIRFPSDGDVEKAIYPVWNGTTPKYLVLKSFFEFLNKNLKVYKPEIILSADLFGYAAIRAGDVGIGQRLDDVEDSFDYISFMLYPSHYYSGFYLPPDASRKLSEVKLNKTQARTYPEIVVSRSLFFARDFLDGKISSSTFSNFSLLSTTSLHVVDNPLPYSKARLRPWLEDFFHEEDKSAGRPTGAKKVRAQIDAAESVEKHGWMLWNAANVYTEGALKRD